MVMDRSVLSTDQLEQRMLARRTETSRLAAEDLADLEELDRRQVATGDGCRSLSEWVSARFDVGLDTARRMVRTMRRTVDRPDLREALADGVSFDRVEAVSKIPDDVGLLEHLDVAGVRREAAKHARITVEAEHRSAGDRFLVLQPSLDESWWKLWGGLDGPSGSLVDKVLAETGDALPYLPDGTRGDGSWRKATALIEVCTTGEPPPVQVTVFVDAKEAAETVVRPGSLWNRDPGREPKPYKRFSVMPPPRSSPEPKTGDSSNTAADPGPSPRRCAGRSSTVTVERAPPTAATAATGSRPTT